MTFLTFSVDNQEVLRRSQSHSQCSPRRLWGSTLSRGQPWTEKMRLGAMIVYLVYLVMIVYLVVLETEPRGIWVAAVVEEGHGGEDRPSHWNDVELGDVVALQDALRHLQPIGPSYLEMPG